MIQLMAQFKIGARIAAGFAVVLALIAVLVFLSYRSGDHATESLSNYARVSQNAVLIGHVDANVANMRRQVISYVNTTKPEAAEAARSLRAVIDKDLDNLVSHTNDPARKARYQKLKEILASYSLNFDKVFSDISTRNEILEKRLNVIGPQASDNISKIMQQALNDGSPEVAARAGLALESLLKVRLGVLRYMSTPTPEVAETTRNLLTSFTQRAKSLETSVSGERLRLTQETISLMDQYISAFTTLAEKTADVDRLVTQVMVGQAENFGQTSAEALVAAQNRMDEQRTAAVEEISHTQGNSLMLGLAALVLGTVAGIVITIGITRPVNTMTEAMASLAGGNLDTEVPATTHRDEIGEMAKAVQVFKDNALRVRRMEAEQKEAEQRVAEEKKRMMNQLADSFQDSVGHVVDTVSSAATELEATAQTMATIAEETERQSTAVSAASEQASGNVQTVASAAEELSSSISEIGRQVQHSSEITSRAAEKAAKTHQVMKGLSDSASQIGEVVNLITNIAEQTNLLALNATIEAARAGDAGKGFAVVANEVKNLANQTGRATEEISTQIANVQSETHLAVAAIDEIVSIIGDINEVASSIAAAVEQQSAATQEIARNVEQAAAGTGDVSANIQGVTQAAGEAGAASEQVVSASQELAQNAAVLRQEVASFVSRVRSA